MSTNNKYLVLRGKNKDIYFIQKRVSKKISTIIGKDFIKKSLETNDIIIARERRDKILEELQDIEDNHQSNNVRIDSKNIDLEEEKYVPTKYHIENHDAYKIEKTINEADPKDINVPMKNTDLDGNYDKSDGYFSFIDYSKLPKRDDILAFLDKITPFAIAFLVIFVTLLV